MQQVDELLGLVVGGRWRLRSLLGTGGMGSVYVADDLAHGPAIAVKLVKRELFNDANVRARFDREAEALRRLEHPNIVRLLDTGETQDLRWIAMERLEGQTLKNQLASTGRLPWRDTLPIVRAIGDALQAAHRAGLIHRDIKPENVFLVAPARAGDPPHVKLIDFGIARHLDLPAGQTMTATGVIVGTPGFVAPEIVVKGTSDDPRSDFYSLGVSWYEMLTGERPFEAATPFALVMLHVSQPAPRPAVGRPDLVLPPRLEALLMSLLAKSPEARPATAEVLLEELAALERAPEDARAPGLRATPPTGAAPRLLPDLHPGDPTATAGIRTRRPAPRRARPPQLLSAALLGVGLVALAVIGLAFRGEADDHEARVVEPRSESWAPRPRTDGSEPPAPTPGPASPDSASAAPCDGTVIGSECLAAADQEEQVIRLISHVEVQSDTIRAKGFARVNGGSAMYFWDSSTPPTVVIHVAEGALDSDCRARLATAAGAMELVGRGAFLSEGQAPKFIGTFTLAKLDKCSVVAGH